jgi:WhiB family redox-sensing transcriptional regulator
MSPARLERADSLYQLLTQLRGEDFGGRPACATVDPDLFFAEPGQTRQTQQAKAVCARCPVLTSCRAFALRTQVHGVWGGMTQDERTKARSGHGRRWAR